MRDEEAQRLRGDNEGRPHEPGLQLRGLRKVRAGDAFELGRAAHAGSLRAAVLRVWGEEGEMLGDVYGVCETEAWGEPEGGPDDDGGRDGHLDGAHEGRGVTPYYERGGITIYHGDCREILTTMERVDCVVTSPPYNIRRNHSHAVGPNSLHKRVTAKFLNEWYDDSVPEADYQASQRAMVAQLLKTCDGSVFYNHKLRHGIKRIGRVIHPMEWLYGLPLWCEIVWDRGGGLAFNSLRFIHSDERIYQFGHPKVWHDLGFTTVWRIPPTSQGVDHPCPFPIEIPSRCIASTTDPGDLILDPFMGSGTTLGAAKDLGRRAIGIEIEERYCEVAAKRMEQEVLPL